MSHEVEILLVEDSAEAAELTIRALRRRGRRRGPGLPLLPWRVQGSHIRPSSAAGAARFEAAQDQWHGSVAGHPGR
jgi:hypothetical protein